MKELILKHTLVNAVRYNGKASVGSVIGHLLGEKPELKKEMKTLSKEIAKAVAEINKMKPEEQKKLLDEKFPGSDKRETKEHDVFAFLGIKEKENVVTAFPPEPSKYPHIGHAKAILLNYELAKRNKGKFILRFEDTNPQLAKKEYYDIHLDNYKWLGIKYDKLDYASDHMEEFYKEGEKLIKDGNAYVCFCEMEAIRAKRAKGEPCKCRGKSSIYDFRKMGQMKPGEAILRVKIDLEHKNSAMRDPAMMRIIDESHCRTGKKYRLWPTYDFENAVMDGIEGVTHRLRSKEFEMRNELQRHIQKLLGFKETKIFEFARFNMEGVGSSGRIIREMIEKKQLIGWDDPSLTTLVALKRRGFMPEAIKSFLIKTGITKSESTLTWDDLIMHNKRLLDSECNRYFFIDDPVEIKIKGAPGQKIKLKLHPEDEKRGFREFNTKESFYITKNDFKEIKENNIYRLMDCLNFKKTKSGFEFDSLEHEKYKKDGKKIIHWLPKDNLIDIEILMPDKSIMKGFAESGIKNVKKDDIIQFERFGFCKLDSKNKFWFTHN